MSAPLRIAVAGAGRMGQAVREVIDARDDCTLAGLWRRGEALRELLADADVLIDFSLPAATAEVLSAALDAKTPLVCGVTGLDDAALLALDDAAASLPVLYARNMSLGVAVLDDLAGRAARALGDGFGVRIDEVHHVHKQDAPSGTALQLGDTVAKARGIDPERIDIRSERRGEVPGEHSVIFTSPTETLTLAHSVATRAVFAEGAVLAARWLGGQPPGRYSMRDVLAGR